MITYVFKKYPPHPYELLRYSESHNHSPTPKTLTKSSTQSQVPYLSTTRPVVQQSFSTPATSQPHTVKQMRPPYSSSQSVNPSTLVSPTSTTVVASKKPQSAAILSIGKSLKYEAQSPISTHKSVTTGTTRTSSTLSQSIENPPLLSSSYHPTTKGRSIYSFRMNFNFFVHHFRATNQRVCST